MPEELQKIDRIIVRYLLKEADAAEKRYLIAWLKEDILNRHYFFGFRDIWDNSRKNNVNIKTDESWNAVKESINKEKYNKSGSGKTIRLLLYAAAIIVLFMLGFTAYFLAQRNFKTETIVQYTQIETKNGNKKEITLPDGTKVWLNSGTTFKYGDNYNVSDREVFLVGEAFFEVAHDETKTFIVKAGELKIKVLGTSFNVNCYPENEVVETTVISGIVSIENEKPDAESDIVILNKLEKGTYVKDQQRMLIERKTDHNAALPITINKITLNDEQTNYIASWKDQTLSFDNETFEEIAVKLQRWFNVSIVIEDAELKNYRYKGKFENVRSIYQVLEVVKLATPITYEYNEKTREITIKELKK